MDGLVARRLELRKLLKKEIFFLFGPRATGKSTLTAQQLPNAVVLDLLKADLLLRLSSAHSELEPITDTKSIL